MGTNYYLQKNKCKCCGKDDKLHIGKSSHGWEFTFRGHEYLDSDWAGLLGLQSIKSYADTLLAIKKAKIIDEYGDYISQKGFKLMVREKKNLHKHMVDSKSYFDNKGNYFSFSEFC